jgi:hypothetical protein
MGLMLKERFADENRATGCYVRWFAFSLSRLDGCLGQEELKL